MAVTSTATFVPTIEETITASGAHRQMEAVPSAPFVPTIEETITASGAHRQMEAVPSKVAT